MPACSFCSHGTLGCAWPAGLRVACDSLQNGCQINSNQSLVKAKVVTVKRMSLAILGGSGEKESENESASSHATDAGGDGLDQGSEKNDKDEHEWDK